jgi:hypothetical protein
VIPSTLGTTCGSALSLGLQLLGIALNKVQEEANCSSGSGRLAASKTALVTQVSCLLVSVSYQNGVAVHSPDLPLLLLFLGSLVTVLF